MKTSRLEEWQAHDGERVWVWDVLACNPGRRGADARAEMLRRAQALGRAFGSRSGDRVERVRVCGTCERR